MARQITTLFVFYLIVLRLNKLYVVNIAYRRESHVIIWYSNLFTVSRPSSVKNVESNVLDMTNLRCEIERELSMVAQRASLGGNKQQRDNTLINWDPSHEDQLSRRHVTGLNQGLSSLTPFGVGRRKTLGMRLGQTLLSPRATLTLPSCVAPSCVHP